MGYPNWTKQETFDIVAAHLLKQGEQSKLTGSTVCAYHGNEGRKCAAGVLIPEGDYTIAMEGRGVRHLCDIHHPDTTWYGHDVKLVRNLQIVHDDSPVVWKDRLANIAWEYGLDKTVLTRSNHESK